MHGREAEEKNAQNHHKISEEKTSAAMHRKTCAQSVSIEDETKKPWKEPVPMNMRYKDA